MSLQDRSYAAAEASLFGLMSITTSAIETAASRREDTLLEVRTYLSRIGLSHTNSTTAPNPTPCFNSIIHVTGTKGKGSTTCMCESIVRRKYGRNTAMFTSPHLVCVRERIRFNGLPVSEGEFAEGYFAVYNMLKEHYDSLNERRVLLNGGGDDDTSSFSSSEKYELNLRCFPAYFRFTTLLALHLSSTHTFSNSPTSKTDVLFLEVGMGGRYDATNLFERSIATCVTVLDLDHTRVLGDTLAKIAWEKGGIFKSDSPAFTILQKEGSGSLEVLRKCASDVGVELVVIEDVDQIVDRDVDLGLKGDFQRTNAALAVVMSRAANFDSNNQSRSQTYDELDEGEREGLKLSTWPGRCQIVKNTSPSKPDFYLDGAHTELSMSACTSWFNTQMKSPCNFGKKKVLLFNTSHERNPLALLGILCEDVGFDRVVFCASNTERPSPIKKASAGEILASAGMKRDVGDGYVEKTWQDTLRILWSVLTKDKQKTSAESLSLSSVEEAMPYLDEECVVLCTGSLYIVGSILEEVKWIEEPAYYNAGV